MNKRKVNIGLMLIVASLLMFSPIATYANEVNDNNEVIVTESEESIQEETQAENSAEKEEKGKDTTENTSVDNQKVDENNNQNNAQNNEQNNNSNDNETTNPDNQTEVHKVAVITTKIDENGNPLSGAVLQILDSEGNVVDEWTSDGTEHESLLPEGDYILHEVSAPEGYKLALDKAFTVKVELNEVTAGVVHDDSHDVCWHNKGVPLYYIESNGVREEVYCVNQGWEEPHDISFDGVVLTEENIKSFMPDADPTMTAEELYNKVLDIIYHRTKAEESFPDLTETEIRMITEYALKNYTSALYSNGTWARYYAYSEESPDGYVIDPENGTTLRKLAQHWKSKYPAYGHGQKLPQKYADYYFYLIRDEDHHPSDMHLYIYSTKAMKGDKLYQNLLSVIWYNPYDENHVVNLTMVNKKATESPKKETPKKVKKSSIVVNPQTGDNIVSYVITLTLSIASLVGVSSYRKKEF